AGDPLCGTGNGRCQASHWRDGLRNALMDPTLALGEQKDITADDRTAIDFIGYENTRLLPPKWKLLGRWKWICTECPPPFELPGMPEVPEPPKPPSPWNLEFIAVLELRPPDVKDPVVRGIRGHADFRPSRVNLSKQVRGL